ncbi:hypothetical protein V2J09_023104 [Rumex salicifolius]
MMRSFWAFDGVHFRRNRISELIVQFQGYADDCIIMKMVMSFELLITRVEFGYAHWAAIVTSSPSLECC